MTLTPLLDASPAIQIHVALAMLAIGIAPFALLRKRRDRLHKTLGYIWVVTMAGVALSSFGIHAFAMIGPFSPIHLFAIYTLWSLWRGLRHALRGDYRAHRATYQGLYWYGLLVAGSLNFLPGRRINQMMFGGNDGLGLVLVGALALALAVYHLNRRWRAVRAA